MSAEAGVRSARWGVALRIGRRDAVQHRERSLLVVVLIAIAAGVVALPMIEIGRALAPNSSFGVMAVVRLGMGMDPAARYGVDESTLTFTAVVAALAAVQAVLLIAPAFLIGVRRRVGELRLLAAVGARPSDVRRTVLAPALLSGGVGSVLGVGLTLGLLMWTAPATEPIEWLFAVVAGVCAVGFGVVVSAVAAWYPADVAVRPEPQRPREPLAGRRLAAAAGTSVLLGAGLSAWGAVQTLAVAVVVGVTVVEVGLVLLLAAMLRVLGRLPSRRAVAAFVLRDATRHPVRVLPAVAASLTLVAGVVGAICYQATTHRDIARTTNPVFVASDAPTQAVLVVAGTVAVLVVTWITTALAAEESQSDLEIFEAVGASAWVRRRMAAGQAAVVSVPAACFGVPAGLALGLLLVRVQADQVTNGGRPIPSYVIPWTAVLLLMVGLPAIVSTVAGLTARTGVRTGRPISRWTPSD
ncbi:FtsX-like permease family protein [Cellulomonas sp. McL0617]|uniref:FtsX-like permease family protein n=1 Tax=Cellulomonas sp. McL0617 TaxID=3415675 RepID=UPI003CF81231